MTTHLTAGALRQALADEFRSAVEAVVGNVLTTSAVPSPSGAAWSTSITASGLVDGRLTAWVDVAGVSAIARAMMGIDDAPEPSVAADMLKELWAQAMAATSMRDGFDGLTLVGGAPAEGALPEGGDGFALLEGSTVMATLVLAGTVNPGIAPAVTATTPAPTGGRAEYPGNLAALLDIDLPLVVRFARTEMSLRALAQLGPGSMVDMGRSPDAPVQLLIGSQVVAEGEVVVVAGNYGVRITSLVSPADRLRAMEL